MTQQTQTSLTDTALIVLYKSSIMDSTSVTSLLNADINGVTLKIVIWNNGPNYLVQEDVDRFENECNAKGITFDIYQDVRNVSLSHLYNFVISQNRESDFFTILDQDSVLSSDFLSNLVRYSEYDVICPRVFSHKNNKNQQYPILPKSMRLIPEGVICEINYTTIGSGLSISKNLLINMFTIFNRIFDERYVFYNVDAEFFHSFDKIVTVKGYCCGKMLHEESNRLSVFEMPENAKLEMGYMILIHRIAKGRNILRNMRFCFRHWLEYKCSFLTFFKMFKIIFTKQHPRYKFRIPNDFKPDYSNHG